MSQKRITKPYDQEFKSQAVKPAQETGRYKASEELGVPSGTIYAWVKAFKEGYPDAKAAVHVPNNALSLNEELNILHIGYCIGSKWWNMGVTSEALKANYPFSF